MMHFLRLWAGVSDFDSVSTWYNLDNYNSVSHGPLRSQPGVAQTKVKPFWSLLSPSLSVGYGNNSHNNKATSETAETLKYGAFDIYDCLRFSVLITWPGSTDLPQPTYFGQLLAGYRIAVKIPRSFSWISRALGEILLL